MTTAAAAEPSIGQFELKNLEAGAGYLEFQSQNAYSFGQPGRRIGFDAGGGPIYDENSVTRLRNALEIEMGFSQYLKLRLGIEFEQGRIDDPVSRAQANSFDELKLDELGAEVIGIIIPRKGDGFGLGVVVEVERPLDTAETSSVIVGPIFEFASGPWSATVIPMGVHAFGGERDEDGFKDHKWDFAYAAKVEYMFSDAWSLAVESYGTVERIGNSGHRSEEQRAFGDFNQHRIGPVLYYAYNLGDIGYRKPTWAAGAGGDDEEGSTLTVGLGLLAGLNENTPDGTLKLSVEVDY